VETRHVSITRHAASPPQEQILEESVCFDDIPEAAAPLPEAGPETPAMTQVHLLSLLLYYSPA
jgi:hypothetical protein